MRQGCQSTRLASQGMASAAAYNFTLLKICCCLLLSLHMLQGGMHCSRLWQGL
jgi:hypothetical protein